MHLCDKAKNDRLHRHGLENYITLRAVKSNVAKFLPHSSTCNATSWLGINSRLATSIKKIAESVSISVCNQTFQ
jgi:hypothetical protein